MRGLGNFSAPPQKNSIHTDRSYRTSTPRCTLRSVIRCRSLAVLRGALNDKDAKGSDNCTTLERIPHPMQPHATCCGTRGRLYAGQEQRDYGLRVPGLARVPAGAVQGRRVLLNRSVRSAKNSAYSHSISQLRCFMYFYSDLLCLLFILFLYLVNFYLSILFI